MSPLVPAVPANLVPGRWFFLAAISIVLTLGASWGVWLLFLIARAGRFTGISIHQVNAHGHAQVFGWVGLFVMGFAYEMFPALWQRRLAAPRLCRPVFIAVTSGVLVHTIAMAAQGARWALPVAVVAGLIEIAAISAFAAQSG